MTIIEFVVPGEPVSQQTHNRPLLQRWKQRVRSIAAASWTGPPVAVDLRFVAMLFHVTDRSRLDDDNMLKPLRDALNGLVYNDDRQIIASATQLCRLGTTFNLDTAPRTLVLALEWGIPFVYIKVESAPDPAELLR